MKRTWRDDFIYPVHARGYSVRLRKSTGLRSKYFAAPKYGGDAGALRAARRYRDEQLAQRDYPARRSGDDGRRRPAYNTEPRGTNSSGVVGVFTDGAAWIAFYHPRRNKQKSRSFSIRKYGYNEARAMAIAWRKKMTAQL